MGCFSWTYCDSKGALKIGDTGYLLIPQEFVEKYGSSAIKDSYYDGYGRINGYDVYEVVAEMNKEHLDSTMLMPETPIEKFGGLWQYEKDELKKKGVSIEEIEKLDLDAKRSHYESNLRRRNKSIERLIDYKTMSDEEMDAKWGVIWKREIGIDIACYDEQNERLPYPIKIARSSKSKYEECKASKEDPDQGF